MARKANKAADILELLNAGVPSGKIVKRLKASPSYVWKLKKEMAHKAEESQQEAPKPAEFVVAEGELEAPEIDAILDQRANQYGSFLQSAHLAVTLKGTMHNAIARADLHLFPDQLLALDMIAVKISRILTGNPSHLDSWLDIAGYAKLVADRLQGNVR